MEEKLLYSYLKSKGVNAEEAKKDFVGVLSAKCDIFSGKTVTMQQKEVKADSLEYHFSIFLEFYSEVDINLIAKNFNIKPYKITQLSEAKHTRKTAKLWYITETFNNIFVGQQIDAFAENLKNEFNGLKQVLAENNGVGIFEVVFNSLKVMPNISMRSNTMKTLNELGLNFEVDFLID